MFKVNNPLRQKSDNGPPFNLIPKKWQNLQKNRNFGLVKILPRHPAANNFETVMKPLENIQYTCENRPYAKFAWIRNS